MQQITELSKQTEILTLAAAIVKNRGISDVFITTQIWEMEQELSALMNQAAVTDFGNEGEIDPNTMLMGHVEFHEGSTFLVPVFLGSPTIKEVKPKRKYTKKVKTDA